MQELEQLERIIYNIIFIILILNNCVKNHYVIITLYKTHSYSFSSLIKVSEIIMKDIIKLI
jgi:hypothetical protein